MWPAVTETSPATHIIPDVICIWKNWRKSHYKVLHHSWLVLSTDLVCPITNSFLRS